jgi:DNA polymerase bacteriophage-type
MKLFIDTETYSPVPINQGTARYSTQVEVIIVTWAVDDGPVHLWEPDVLDTMPPALANALDQADEIIAHNAYFERSVLRVQPWFKVQPLTQWRCTMAMAFAHGLPGKLDQLCTIFKVPLSEAKHDGKDLIQFFCKPQGTTKARNLPRDHRADWRKFCEYAKSDITALRAIYKKLPKWNCSAFETALWHLDQTINDRGVAVDTEFAKSIVMAVAAEQKILNARTMEITQDTIQRTTQRDLLLGYLLLEYGVELPDLTADTVERRLKDPELPEYVKELLRIRLKASKSSSSKYKRLLSMEVAGRLYGTLQYCAANRTGRWGGRGFQPQNLPRPSHKAADIEHGIEAAKAGCLDLVTDNVMALASSALRGALVAAKGKKLVISDLSNIEGRKLAWLAGEQWKLDAFAAFDAGEGEDLYKVSYGRAFGVDPASVEKDSDERQIGKVMELALGYEGGVGAFVTMASTYGVDLELMAEKAWHSIPATVMREAESTWRWAEQQRRTLGLRREVYIVCDALKRMWRNAHPAITQFWDDLKTAALIAIQNPNTVFKAGEHISFDRVGAWLRMRLPSGRYLCYPDPKADGGKISYVGVNTYSRKWSRISTYGGKLAENATQASSRDIMAYAMFAAEEAGYPLVLTVHDELMTEVPDTEGYTDAELSTILATNPQWAKGLPLAAAGSTKYRYGKG